jgi:hypothetical protein
MTELSLKIWKIYTSHFLSYKNLGEQFNTEMLEINLK